MRAFRHDASGTRLASTHPEPVPAPGEAILRPLRMSVAALDLNAARNPSHAGTLGHEFVAVVEVAIPLTTSDVHARAAAAFEGKRVVGAINIVCGQCARCRGGLSNHCAARKVLGLHQHDGTLADRFTLPLANLVEVPKAIPDDHAIFAHSLAAALHTAQPVRLEGKTFVTILGDGPVALLAAQVLSRKNASVRLLGKHPEKFTLCERWGIKHRHISEVGRRQDQDVVIDCTGSPSGLDLAVQLLRPRGKIVLKSTPTVLAPPAIPAGEVVESSRPEGVNPSFLSPATLAALVTNELELHGTRCGKVSDAVAALLNKEADVSALISSRYKITSASEAFDAAAHPDSVKVVVEP